MRNKVYLSLNAFSINPFSSNTFNVESEVSLVIFKSEITFNNSDLVNHFVSPNFLCYTLNNFCDSSLVKYSLPTLLIPSSILFLFLSITSQIELMSIFSTSA